jgi:hypothetical protein
VVQDALNMDLKRLEQFMLIMLSSDQPGEVAAASAMLKRELKKGGKDIHWLKDNLLNGKSSAPHEDLRGIVERERLRLERDVARHELRQMTGERNKLKHELDTIKRAAAGQAEPADDMPDTASEHLRRQQARKERWERFDDRTRQRSTKGWYEDHPGEPPPDTAERIHIASWCLRYLTVHNNLLKSAHEGEFIQHMARHYGVLSYAQETWLMDVFYRLRRHHSMMSDGG